MPKYTHAHSIFHNLLTPFNTSSFASSISVCTFILFSGGEGWCEHNGLCVSPQLWDRGRQENCHRFWNRYPVWLRPLLLVRHTHTHISCFSFSHMQTKFSCYIYISIWCRIIELIECRDYTGFSSNPLTADVLEAMSNKSNVFYGRLQQQRKACFYWLWLCRGSAWLAVAKLRVWETRTMAFCFCSHVFPVKWRHHVFCGHSLKERELDSAAIWNCKLLEKCRMTELKPFSPPSVFTSFSVFPSLHPPSSLTSTTRRSSAALRVCRNSEPSTEVTSKTFRSQCVLMKYTDRLWID